MPPKDGFYGCRPTQWLKLARQQQFVGQGRSDVGWHWLESGAGDGNRKYRSDTHNPLKSGHYEIGEALRVINV
jgi:hypothetical protein